MSNAAARTVYSNDRSRSLLFGYAANQVKTTRYTPVTFLPKNLFEQFHRFANCYFLFMIILAFIPATRAVNPATAALPLIFVLTTSAIKDAIEDYKRRRTDKEVNRSLATLVPATLAVTPISHQERMDSQATISWTQALANKVDALVASLADACAKEGLHAQLIHAQETRRRLPAPPPNTRRVLWQDIHVGDIVRLVDGDQIPADMLVLSTSDPMGVCYVDTASMDGETNLKAKDALPCTKALYATPESCADLDARVQCEAPSNNLFRFEGSIAFRSDNFQATTPITISNMLFRSCILRNTEYVYGLVLYAGHDTKVYQNNTKGRFKRTKMEKMMNREILMVFFVLIGFCLVGAVLSSTPGTSPNSSHWYLTFEYSPALNAFINFWCFALILQSMVPISLYVTVEIVKIIQAYFISSDIKMYWPETDTPAWARTSALSEELGQVEYIFSDKTGTLTQNKMDFHGCSIDGVVYGSGSAKEKYPVESDCPYSSPTFVHHDKRLIADRFANEKIANFWRHLAICHTVLAEFKEENKQAPKRLPSTMTYQAASPDEAALVAAAKDFGFAFHRRDHERITINVNGKDEVYDVLNVLEFNSDRKRMSVIVRNPKDNSIRLLCKGADDMILKLLRPVAKSESQLLRVPANDGRPASEFDMVECTRKHLEEFAKSGLRTLCLAYKDLTEAEWRAFDEKFHQATISSDNREQRVDEVSAEIERELTLIGATAVDDKLQDHVPETIATLAKGRIKLWMLTGDKQETAINIGFSCKLFRRGMEVLVLNAVDAESTKARLEELTLFLSADKARLRDSSDVTDYGMSESSIALNTMSKSASTASAASTPLSLDDVAILRNNGNPSIATSNSGTSSSGSAAVASGPLSGFGLVINGMTLQYALSPELAPLFLSLARQCESVVCCRCSPLQKAKVVDLVRKGVRAVTLAIGDGANDVSMIKAANIGVGISGKEGMQAVMASDYAIAQFSFLKRLLLVHGVWSYHRIAWLVLYFFYKNYAYILINFWFNIFSAFSAQTVYEYTFIMFYNLAFTSLPPIVVAIFEQPVTDRAALKVPELYVDGLTNQLFNTKRFWLTIVDALYQSLVCFFIPYGAETVLRNGKTIDMWAFGTIIFTVLVIVVNLRVALDTRMWTVLNATILGGSILLWFLYMLTYMNILPFMNTAYGIVWVLFPSPMYWFTVAVTVVVALFPYWLVSVWRLYFSPSAAQVVNEMYTLRLPPFAQLASEKDLLEQDNAFFAGKEMEEDARGHGTARRTDDDSYLVKQELSMDDSLSPLDKDRSSFALILGTVSKSSSRKPKPAGQRKESDL